MKTKRQRSFLALTCALAGLTVLACAKENGGGSAPASTETGSATAQTPSTNQTAPTRAAPAAPPAVVPATAGAPQIETQAALPSPAVLEAVSGARARLDGLAASVEGARVRFVDCDATAKCSARVEAPTLAGLRDLLQAMSADQGGISFGAREQLDGYAGRTFVADVTLGAEAPRAVPTDPDALLGAVDSP